MTTIDKEQLIVKINTLPDEKLEKVAEFVAKLTKEKEDEKQDELSLLIETTNKKYEKVWEALA
ncbi:MAG: hypothetical protein EAZ85_00155 [Bacteroidetes bacterium]|nr:MAG: hypothetical protein EAZ85_00155 [Bacteroidota bacterium]TAG90565.1 MAG: hypothetical protein EAZ20_04060 [Bacteroidota bacterium]